MPDGRNNSVDLLVASIPAFLVMKGYALRNRDKKKDAYDIYFSVKNFAGGPNKLATDCATLLTDPAVTSSFEYIAQKFRSADDFGPQTVRAFLTSSDALGELSPDQVQTDSYMQVRAWLRALGLAT
jgi:DNA modification methylase